MVFALEDIYGFTDNEADGEICLKASKDKSRNAYNLLRMFFAWKELADKPADRETDREEYDCWRYYYPHSSIPPSIG